MQNGISALEQANTTLIRYPRFKELHKKIRRCQEMSRIAGEPQCMSLEGVTGAGKSTLVRNYAEQFPRHETTEGTAIPVFYLETPSPVTVKGMASVLLERLGDPAAHKGALWSMNSRLVRLIIDCGVELVIMDEFHHLIDSETKRILEKVSDWLKMLIKETGVPFLVVGIEDKVELILRANSQLSRLFAMREKLQPFGLDFSRPETIKTFGMFLKYAEQMAGMPLPWNSLDHADLIHRIHFATAGVVGNVVNLVRFSVLIAQEQQSDVLTLPILSEAFEERLAKHLSRPNPFISTEPFVEPALPDANKSNARQRKISASTVLKTR